MYSNISDYLTSTEIKNFRDEVISRIQGKIIIDINKGYYLQTVSYLGITQIVLTEI
jgi:hypothetical protein